MVKINKQRRMSACLKRCTMNTLSVIQPGATARRTAA
jgi:hypothetical protein